MLTKPETTFVQFNAKQSKKFSSVKSSLLAGSFALLVAFSIATPAAAAQPLPLYDGNMPPDTSVSAPPPLPDNEQTWRQHYAERRDVRETRQELRHEHDILEAERESIKLECLDAKGQEHTQCQAKWADWHMRKDALMMRMHAMQGPAGMERPADHAAVDHSGMDHPHHKHHHHHADCPAGGVMPDGSRCKPGMPPMPAHHAYNHPANPQIQPTPYNGAADTQMPVVTTGEANDNIGNMVTPMRAGQPPMR